MSVLSSDNAHHDFEHLCRHLARRRIYSNVIPATGPVAGGGDKGADFETLHVENDHGIAGYWGLTSAGKVIFACSLEQNVKRKIRSDVKAAAAFGEPVDRLYFFYNRPIKVGDRHRLKKEALEEHGIKLEIVDGNAISEFLADPELLWIAERYLSLPSGITLQSSKKVPSWYSDLLTVSESSLPTNSDTFYQLKSAVRYARDEPDRHSDIPKIIRRLRRFCSHTDRVVARKAFYEEFVATLRGLNAAEGLESQVIEYLTPISALDSPPELEDAAVILSYLNGACARGILDVDVSIRKKFRDELIAKLDSLLTPTPTFVNCSLLFAKGNVLLNSSALEADGPSEQSYVKAADNAAEVWGELLKFSREVVLFPVERLRSIVSFLFPLVNTDKFTLFVKHLDEITAERAGAKSLAEEHTSRGSALLDAKDHLRALSEFHEALTLSHSLKSQEHAITVCLQLSALYQHLGLCHAAKYYGLAAAYASLRLPEDDVRRLAAVGLSYAAQADYMSGASLMFFLTCRMFMIIESEFAMAGKKSFREEQWATVQYYCLLLTRAAKLVNSGCHEMCLEVLRALGGYEVYTESEQKLHDILGARDRSSLSNGYQEQGIASPFSDCAPVRRTSWKQLGITWKLEWPSTYPSEQQGEALCATLQVVLAAVVGSEFSVVTTDVAVSLETKHKGEMSIRQMPDNEVLRFSISVDPHIGIPLEGHLTIAYTILRASSGIPSDEFKQRFEEEFKRGLAARIGVYISPMQVFREFYAEADYNHIHRHDSGADGESHLVRTMVEIAEVPQVHPQFDEAEALLRITNRYKRISELFPYTLQQICSAPVFREVLDKLRQSGWKDWHILLAVSNVRVSSILNSHLRDNEESAQTMAESGEKSCDPLTPVAFFNEEQLKRALRMSQLSTIASMGFRVEQMTPNFNGMDTFLRRFKYWELDVPHLDPFEQGQDIQNQR